MPSIEDPPTSALPPDGMSPEANAKWHELLPRLEALIITDQEHLDLLAVICEAVATWREATRRIHEHGHLARVGKTVFQSPWIVDEAVVQITQLATRLGFPPDAPLARRKPAFAEYTQEVDANGGIDDGDGYEIVHAGGTFEVLHV